MQNYQNNFPVRVLFHTKIHEILDGIFDSEITFEDVENYFNQNVQNGQYILKDHYLINNTVVEPEMRLKDLAYAQYEEKDMEGKVLGNVELKIEVDEEEKFTDENEPCYKKLIKPSMNPFRLLVFTSDNGNIVEEEYSDSIIDEYNLKDFDLQSSAYCNTYTHTYISGGLINPNAFWIINHKNYSIKKSEMPFSKSCHSMLYIPDKNNILFAGGQSGETYFYDINNKNFIEGPIMNTAQEQPSLIKDSNYVYSFNSLQDGGVDFFERLDLDNLQNGWEKIYPNFFTKEDKDNFISKLFGVSSSVNHKIVFCAGDQSPGNTYIYEPDSNILYQSSGEDLTCSLNDKTFYKINNLYNVAFPTDTGDEIYLLFLNKKTQFNHGAHFSLGEPNPEEELEFNEERRQETFGYIDIQSSLVEPNNLEEEEQANNEEYNGSNHEEEEQENNEEFNGNNQEEENPEVPNNLLNTYVNPIGNKMNTEEHVDKVPEDEKNIEQEKENQMKDTFIPGNEANQMKDTFIPGNEANQVKDTFIPDNEKEKPEDKIEGLLLQNKKPLDSEDIRKSYLKNSSIMKNPYTVEEPPIETKIENPSITGTKTEQKSKLRSGNRKPVKKEFPPSITLEEIMRKEGEGDNKFFDSLDYNDIYKENTEPIETVTPSHTYNVPNSKDWRNEESKKRENMLKSNPKNKLQESLKKSVIHKNPVSLVKMMQNPLDEPLEFIDEDEVPKITQEEPIQVLLPNDAESIRNSKSSRNKAKKTMKAKFIDEIAKNEKLKAIKKSSNLKQLTTFIEEINKNIVDDINPIASYVPKEVNSNSFGDYNITKLS